MEESRVVLKERYLFIEGVVWAIFAVMALVAVMILGTRMGLDTTNFVSSLFDVMFFVASFGLFIKGLKMSSINKNRRATIYFMLSIIIVLIKVVDLLLAYVI